MDPTAYTKQNKTKTKKTKQEQKAILLSNKPNVILETINPLGGESPRH